MKWDTQIVIGILRGWRVAGGSQWKLVEGFLARSRASKLQQGEQPRSLTSLNYILHSEYSSKEEKTNSDKMVEVELQQNNGA